MMGIFRKNAHLNGNLDLAELLIILAIFLFTFLVRIPFFSYPVVQDTSQYAKLSESLHTSFAYEIGGVPHRHFPPGTSFLASFVLFFTDDSGFSVRLISILFSSLSICLCYIFMRYLGIDKGISLILCAIIFFNPWFFYFTTVLGLSEGAGTFFLLAGFFLVFLYFKGKIGISGIVIASLFLGLSVMMRVVFIVPVAIFNCYFLWQIFHKKKISEGILFISISSILFVGWFLRNWLLKTGSEGYSEEGINALISYPYSLIYFMVIVFPVAFLFLVWHAAKSIKKIFYRKDVYWKLVILSFLCTMLVSLLAWDVASPQVNMIQNPWSISEFHLDTKVLLTNPFFASRYFVPFIPIMVIIVGFIYLNDSRALKKKNILLIYALLLFLGTSFYSSGYLQNIIGNDFAIPQTFVQKADAGLQVLDFLKEENVEGKGIYINVSDPVLADSLDNLLERGRYDIIHEVDHSGLEDAYIISDLACNYDYSGTLNICKKVSCIFRSVGSLKISVFKCD